MKNSISQDLKILMVDDEPYYLSSCERFFRKTDITVLKATRGKEALSIAESEQIDLFILDIMMPEMDGFKVCHCLKNNPKTKNIPVIFLTGRYEEDIIIKGFEMGAQDYIIKPFKPQELLARVKTHLDLKEKTEKLNVMNQELEKKVAERTAQLAESNRRLSNLEKTKGNFLTLISHEMRTPLNGIINLTALLEYITQSEEQKEYIGFLKASTERLIQFSESALLITSLTAEENKINAEPFLIKDLITTSTGKMVNKLGQKSLMIATKLQEDEIELYGDKILIERCLLNILENAIHYSPEKGQILIQASAEDDIIVLEISDDGPGFSEESLSMLFEFFATDDILHHKDGFGLGLAAAKLIMDAHFGKIEVRNRSAKGASVKLLFKCKAFLPG